MDLREVLYDDSLFNKVYNALERCAIRREYLLSDSYLRGIGKTTAILKLAKKFDLYIVVPTHSLVSLIKGMGYEKVITQSEVKYLRGKRDVCLVFDEGVDPKNLEGLNVITGIVNNF